jgi:hypothetical protein
MVVPPSPSTLAYSALFLRRSTMTPSSAIASTAHKIRIIELSIYVLLFSISVFGGSELLQIVGFFSV